MWGGTERESAVSGGLLGKHGGLRVGVSSSSAGLPVPHSQPCLQYWPEPGRQQYGLMEVEFVSGTADEDLVARVFRVQNISRVSGVGAPG